MSTPNKYTKQVIINFVKDHSQESESLKQKWDNRHPDSPCMIIEGTDFLKSKENILEKISKSNDVIRIYVYGHHFFGTDCLTNCMEGDEKVEVNFESLAEQLAYFIGIGDQKVVINLVACNAGKSSQDELKKDDSFAAKLHKSLALKMIKNPPDVIARTARMVVNSELGIWAGEKMTVDLNLTKKRNDARIRGNPSIKDYKRKQPGTKVWITTDDRGAQRRLDAYSHKWKAKVIKAIEDSRATKQPEKNAFLQNRLNVDALHTMTPEQLFKIISSESAKALFQKHSSEWFFMKLFTAATYKRMEPLIAEGERIFKSKHTLKQPLPTGKNTD
jgi:hypothetical protein